MLTWGQDVGTSRRVCAVPNAQAVASALPIAQCPTQVLGYFGVGVIPVVDVSAILFLHPDWDFTLFIFLKDQGSHWCLEFHEGWSIARPDVQETGNSVLVSHKDFGLYDLLGYDRRKTSAWQ